MITLIIVEMIYHAAITLHRSPEPADERDRLIEANATRIACYVLISGCFLALGHLMPGSFFDFSGREDILTRPVMSANLVFFVVILAEITGFAMQFFYYRRDI